MSLVLVTGLPGHCKTLHTLARVSEIAKKDGRPVFYAGIKLKDHEAVNAWTEWEPEKWQDLPPNAIFLVDEAQFRFKVQGRVKPDFIENLSVHRHGGIDIWMITQHPTFLDPFVRKLVDRHFHCMRKFGSKWVTIHEFAQCRDNCEKSAGRKDSTTHEWFMDKRVFEWYHSSEAHTGKLRIPARVMVLAVVPFVLVIAGYYAYQGLWGSKSGLAKAQQSNANGSGAPGSTPGAPNGVQQPLTPAEYAARYQARIPGLPHTAPAYDEVTKPTNAPYPAACLASKTKCHCYSQQATRIDTPEQLCRDIAAGGFFVAWNLPVAQAVPVQPQQLQPVERLAPVVIGQAVQPAPVAGPVQEEQPRPIVRPQPKPVTPAGFGQAVGPA